MKHLFTSLIIAFLSFQSIGLQSQSFVQPCAYDFYVKQLSEKYEPFAEAIEAPFNRIDNGFYSRSNDIYTIDVVVHIVYQNQEQNVSDSIVLNVMDVINEDYRRLNSDADSIRSIFQDRVGDAGIEFNLKEIRRVESDTTFELDFLSGTLPDNVKVESGGGSDAVKPDKHLNIWVCNIEGGSLLGYAYPPAGLENWPAGSSAPDKSLDGVVINHNVFRTSGTYTSSSILGEMQTVDVRGRTITHEIGHYLGLRHIWGDGTLSIIGIPDCDADDGVEDTPNQGLNSSFMCDETQNTCTPDSTNDLPDMWENYMDYSLESCQNSFTNGQIQIMRSVLENERNSLIEESTSTQEIGLKDVSVYPVPAENLIHIEGERMHSSELTLFDINGNKVSTNSTFISDHQATINLDGVQSGVYFIRISDKNTVITKKIVVN